MTSPYFATPVWSEEVWEDMGTHDLRAGAPCASAPWTDRARHEASRKYEAPSAKSKPKAMKLEARWVAALQRKQVPHVVFLEETVGIVAAVTELGYLFDINGVHMHKIQLRLRRREPDAAWVLQITDAMRDCVVPA